MCLRCYKKGWEVGEGIKQTNKKIKTKQNQETYHHNRKKP